MTTGSGGESGQRYKRWLMGERRWYALAALAIAWCAVFLIGTSQQPLRLNWGDPWSDGNAMTSGRYFDRVGFIKLAFTPILDVGPITPDSARYTHYPPLPDIMNGVERRAFGASDIGHFRLFADLLTIASLFFLFRWLRVLWGAATASVTLVLLTTNLLWLQYADTIHHVPYYWFLGFGALAATTKWLERPGYGMLAVIAGAVFLCDLASYDFGVFVPVCVAITIWLTGHRLRDKAMRPLLIAVFAASVLAVVVKILLLIWALGRHAVFVDLFFQFHERATDKHSVTNYRKGVPAIFWYRSLRFFTPLFITLPLIHVASIVLRALPRTRSLRLPPASPLLLLAAGLPFVVVFSQLFVEQYHPTLQFITYYAVGLASVAVWIGSLRRRLATVGAVAIIVFALGWQIREIVTFEKVFLPREDIGAARDYLAANDTRNIVFTNGLVDAPQRYYLERLHLGIGGASLNGGLAWWRAFFDQNGDAPVHLVEYANADKMAFDKLLFAYFGPANKWSWIGDPAGHRAEWEPIVRMINDTWLSGLRDFGTLVVTTPTIKVYRIDKATFIKKVVDANKKPTMEIDFGEPESEQHKLSGVRFAEHPQGIHGFSWTEGVAPRRYKFTLRGMVQKDLGPASKTSELLVRFTEPPRQMTFRVLGSLWTQGFTVSLNGHKLGHADVSKQWTEVTFDIPPEALAPDGLEHITIETDTLNKQGVGVAFEWLKFSP